MQLIVPMAGFGERFAAAGYDRPKPLIEVHGKPMIAHVVSMFPGVERVVLLCNEAHLQDPRWSMSQTLETWVPQAEVVAVASHRAGPVHTLLESGVLRGDEDVIIAMCDLYFDWDLAHFRSWITGSGSEGCVLCYRGFHPHLLHSVHYAFVQEEARWVTAIQEKAPYTDDPMGNGEFCSNGVYWFASGDLARRACEAARGQPELAIAGEHYVSQAYGPLLDEGRAVSVYEVEQFCQWGNPRDLVAYEGYAEAFAHRAALEPEPAQQGCLVVPMAGMGSRFAEQGCAAPKPCLPVLGRPMAAASVLDLPVMTEAVFLLRMGLEALEEELRAVQPDARVVVLDGPTEGQACTVLAGLASVAPEQAVVVGTCDNGLAHQGHAEALAGADLLVWGVRGHPAAALHPKQYGWIDADAEGRVRGISVKQPLEDPSTDLMVVGAFSARESRFLTRSIERLLARDGRVRGEFYLDSAITDALALGYRVHAFEVEHYEGWGTPDEWRTWAYWARHFHLRADHPYRVEGDRRAASGLTMAPPWRPAPLTRTV